MDTRAATPTLRYIIDHLVNEPTSCAAMHPEGEKRHAGMQVSPYEGRLLQWLLQISGAKNVLEVGTFMGYSTAWMAEGIAEGGQITSLEFDAEHAEQAATHLAPYSHVAVVQGDGLAWIKNYNGAPFDFMFIDAMKKSYMDYLDAAMQHLVKGAWVVADNSLLFGNLAGEPNPGRTSEEAKKVMHEINLRLTNGSEFNGVLLPTPEGMTVGVKL